MKIRTVTANNRKQAFEVRSGTSRLAFPYAKADPAPTREDAVRSVEVDLELGREGFTYALASGRTGTVHVEQVLEYNLDPDYMRDQLVYQLTLEAQRRVAESPLSKRELIRRLGTSPAQLYRLLDQTNYGKSVDQLVRLFQALDCDVELVVHARSA